LLAMGENESPLLASWQLHPVITSWRISYCKARRAG
jgi:hypothetical protein